MSPFLCKIKAVTYIYLLLSAQVINAARVKKHFHAVGAGQELQQEAQEVMAEIDQIESDYKLEHHGTWGESWKTCSGRLEDFKRHQTKMQARYDKAMEDGTMSSMEATKIALKSFAVASTLSKATKSGCDWVTNTSMDVSSMQQTMAKSMKQHPCSDAAKDYLKKAQADNVNKDEVEANVMKIMFSVDCKLPSATIEEVQKPFHELAVEEESAEAGAFREVQQVQASLAEGNQTSLLESTLIDLEGDEGEGGRGKGGKGGKGGQVAVVVTIPALALFAYFWFPVLFSLFVAAMTCIVQFSLMAMILTLIFLVIKNLFKAVLGLQHGGTGRQFCKAIYSPQFYSIISLGCLTGILAPGYVSGLTSGLTGYAISAPELGMYGAAAVAATEDEFNGSGEAVAEA